MILVKSAEFLTPDSFELWVEQNKKKFENSYLDTIVNFMISNELDEVDMKELISDNLTNKLKLEAINSRTLRSNIKPCNFEKIF